MNQMLISFLDRLVERFTAILASVISSRVESLRAEVQADQQSQLEDLARKYEVDGKIAIAQSLRERASNMASSDLASDGVKVMDAVAGGNSKPLGSIATGLLNQESPTRAGQLNSLPDFSTANNSRKKPRPNGGNDASGGAVPGAPN